MRNNIIDNSTGAATTAPESTTALRIAGSGTVGQELAPELAKAFLRKGGATDVSESEPSPVSIGGEEGNVITVHGLRKDDKTPTKIEITIVNSDYAFKALAKGDTDIGMASRQVGTSELGGWGSLHDENFENVIAQDAIAVIVNKENPVRSINADLLRGIFEKCSINNWSQVDPNLNAPINAWAYNEGSGTVETFQNEIIPGRALCGGVKKAETDNGWTVSNAVSGDVNSIGIVGLPFVGDNIALKLPSRHGGGLVGPEPENVYSDAYPIIRNLYLYMATRPDTNALAKDFVKFSSSSEGRNLAIRARFLDPLSPESSAEPVRNGECSDTHPELCTFELEPLENCTDKLEYCKFTNDAQKVKFSVNFRSGSADIDTISQERLNELCTVLRSNAYQSYQVLLAGFADSPGDSTYNLTLSDERAVAVQAALQEQRVAPARILEPKGFGEEFAFINPDSPENRRVEIWLRPG